MEEANIQRLLGLLAIHNGDLQGAWVKASCPLAFARHKGGRDANPSFGIRHNPTGRSGYHCFSCNLKGRNLGDLLVEIAYEANRHANAPPMDLAKAFDLVEHENEQGYFSSEWTGKTATVPEFEAWPEWWLEDFPSALSVPIAVEYLQLRKVPVKVVKALDLRFDLARQAIGFPIRNAEKELAGMRGRLVSPHGDLRHYDYKYNNISNVHQVWLGEHHIDMMKPVVVVEGQFDYARVFQVYRNVVANLTTGLSWAKMNKLKSAVEVVEMFDYDKAGRIAGIELEDALPGVVVRHFDYKGVLKSEKDTDPGEMKIEKIAQGLSEFVVLDNPPNPA